MIYFCDYSIAERALFMERNYKKLNTHSFTLVCSCPICGDSKKDHLKARFRIYVHDDSLRAGCFNCSYNAPFVSFLKDYKPEFYRELLLERRKESAGTQSTTRRRLPTQTKEVVPTVECVPFSSRIDTLPANHPIVGYVTDRKIPRDKWQYLWFTTEFQKLANFIKDGTFKHISPEPRLVIPIFNASKKIEAIQGRALRKADAEKAKYLTIKTHEHANKIYGLDRADPSKPVYFLEGPIDSLFVDNGCAITGGSMGLDDVPFKENRVWSLDAEGRAYHTMQRLKKLIDAGEKVVMWDKSPWKSKDINDMIRNEGATRSAIMEYMQRNTVQGHFAKLRFANYAKY